MGAGASSLTAALFIDAVILGIPAFAGFLVALACNVRIHAAQLIYALSGPCVLGYIAVPLYLASPTVGRVVTLVLYFATVALCLVLFVRLREQLRDHAIFLTVMILITLSAAAFSLGLGFLHGVTTRHVNMAPIVATARFRYQKDLPIDNNLPYYFTNALISTHRPIPRDLAAGWSSSDRPPLQSAVYLLVRSIVPGNDPNELHYQITGTLLQCFWIPAVWCFFEAMGASRRARGLGLCVVLVSGFAIANSFYVWPKLFAAAFVVLIASVVFTQSWPTAKHSVTVGAALGLAGALALLGHDGSTFGLVPLIVFVAFRKSWWPSKKHLLALIGVSIVVLLPWGLYQELYAPPGTRLAKLQLAGQNHPHPHQSLVNAIISAYQHLDASEIAHNKLTNFATPFSHVDEEVTSLSRLVTNMFATGGPAANTRDAAILELRSVNFYYLVPSAGLLVFGPIAELCLWFIRRRSKRQRLDSQTASTAPIWWWFVITLVIWALALFGPSGTLIHQGDYATELLVFSAAFLGLWKASPVLASTIVAFQGVLALVIYALFQPRWPGTHVLIHSAIATEGLLAGVGFLVCVASGFIPVPSKHEQIKTDAHLTTP